MTAKTNKPKCKRCPSTDLVTEGNVITCLECGAYTDPYHTPNPEIPIQIPLTSGIPGYAGISELFRSFSFQTPKFYWDEMFE